MGKKTNTPRILPGAGKASAPVEDADVIEDNVPITELIQITEQDKPQAIILAFKEDALKIIAEKKAEYSQLAIAGVNDKEGYAAVKSAMGEMKNSRLVFSRAADEHILDPLKAIVEEVKGGIGAIVTGFKEVEADLRKKKDAIDDEKDRIKEEERVAAIKRVQERTVKLVELGATSDGMVYSFYYSQMLYATASDINDWSEDKFNEFLAEVRVEFDIELARKQAAEQARIDEENERLIRQAALEKEIADRDAETKALKERIGKLRLKELKSLGGIDDGVGMVVWTNKPFHLVIDTITDMPDHEWDGLIADIENYKAPEPVSMPEIKREYPLTPEEVYPADHSADLAPEDQVLAQMVAEEEQLGQTIDEDLVELTMRFFESEPYTDIQLTPRRTMRFFPDEFEAEANTGVDSLASFKVQNLNCIIFDTIN